MNKVREILQADIDTRLVAILCIAGLAMIAIYDGTEPETIFTHAVAAISGMAMGKSNGK